MATGQNIRMDPLEEVQALKSLYTGKPERQLRMYASKPMLTLEGDPDAE
jgi:hypothetical protein